MSESKTPRTDALQDKTTGEAAWKCIDDFHLLCRTLEAELAAANKRIAELEAAAHDSQSLDALELDGLVRQLEAELAAKTEALEVAHVQSEALLICIQSVGDVLGEQHQPAELAWTVRERIAELERQLAAADSSTDGVKDEPKEQS